MSHGEMFGLYLWAACGLVDGVAYMRAKPEARPWSWALLPYHLAMGPVPLIHSMLRGKK